MGESVTELDARQLGAAWQSEFHFAKHVFVHDRERLLAATQRSADCYRRAMDRLPWPAVAVQVPFEGGALPGVPRLPSATDTGTEGPVPVVLVVPGLDATKEEMHRFAEVLLERGIAVLSIDGPGQGESEDRLGIRPDREVVGAAILDVIASDPRLDEQRASVVGVSLGGYYAARAVAADARWRAGRRAELADRVSTVLDTGVRP
ncbi:MAG: alpha/beta fold hydrolase [Pseudonocardia sp.]|nr:alpha/beta fold hydrolase [Pseudonocardia sp.]